MNYQVVVAAYNSERWIEGTLDSIAQQNLGPNVTMDVCVVDDASTDARQRDIILGYCFRRGWEFILNDEHRGAMYNQVAAIRQLGREMSDDVIVIVDGDDQLAHADVLLRLEEYYAGGVDMTYGQYEAFPPVDTCSMARPYPRHVNAEKSFRRFDGGLLFNHLRTFKRDLFEQLDDSDFTWPTGEWFQACADTAIMIPCLELANSYACIQEVLYHYNSDNPISDWRPRAREIDRIHDYILGELPKKVPHE